MNNVIANELKDRLGIEPGSVLSSLVTFACQPTKLRRVPNRKQIQREAGKYLRKFRDLAAEAVVAGVTDKHLIEAGTISLRYVRFPDPMMNHWSSENGVRNYVFRKEACYVLDRAIDAARREKYVAVRDQDYTFAEIKRICARSGSRFFKDLDKGERVSMASKARNTVKVKGRDGSRYYEFIPNTGDMEFIGETLPM